METIIVIAVIAGAIYLINKFFEKKNEPEVLRAPYRGVQYIDKMGKESYKRFEQNIYLYQHKVSLTGYINKDYDIVDFKNFGQRIIFTLEYGNEIKTLILELNATQAYFYEESLSKDAYIFTNLL